MDLSAEPKTKTDNSFGRYRVLANLGRGGMAAIHLAVIEGPSGFNKLVVLKQILPDFAHDPEIVGMFLDEARLAARLSHSNVVQTNEVGFEDDTHFLAMEYLDGQSLGEILRRLRSRGGLPIGMHLQVIADLLAGLHYAHELEDYDGSPLGVVHCDVNPQNTFVTYDGVVKVVDFGVAKARTALTENRPGVLKGKLAYMAPEQLRGEELDRRTDIFAVGVMLWEAATGKRPWRGRPVTSMIQDVLAGHFPAPCSSNSGVPVELEAIILKALSFEPENRYATAAELQVAIDAYLDTIGGRLAQREVGKLIASAFESERSVLTSLIEEQLQACSESSPGGPRPLPLLIQTSPDGDRETLEPHTPVPRETSLAAGSALTLPEAGWRRTGIEPKPEDAAPRVSIVLPAPLPAPLPATGGDTSSTTAPVVSGSRRFGPFGRRQVLFAAFFLVVGALGAASSWQTLLSYRTREGVSSGAPNELGSAQGNASTTVQLQLVASPKEARLFLDDVPLAGNPFVGEIARDGSVHRVRVEAPGYLSRVEEVRLDRNTFIDLELVADLPPSPIKIARAREPAHTSASSAVVAPHAPVIVQW